MKRVRSSRLILVNSFRTLEQLCRSPFTHLHFLSHVSFIILFSSHAVLKPRRKKIHSHVILNIRVSNSLREDAALKETGARDPVERIRLVNRELVSLVKMDVPY